MYNDIQLMDLHIRTCFTYDEHLRLVGVNEPGGTGSPAPRLFLGRTTDGNVWRFGANVADDICRELDVLCSREPRLQATGPALPAHIDRYVELLGRVAGDPEVESGFAYHFRHIGDPGEGIEPVTEQNAHLLAGGFEKLLDELSDWQPFVALIAEQRAVSVCRSVRISVEAHEAGVETLAEHRGNGYAERVVSAWARRVQEMDALPLYSTSLQNRASQAVARKLGLRCYGHFLHIS
jgi:hypothetical protein